MHYVIKRVVKLRLWRASGNLNPSPQRFKECQLKLYWRVGRFSVRKGMESYFHLKIN
jgi:hypothetical protein